MKHPSHTAQAGSAFFLILIAIFLFAALSYAMTRGSRSSVSSLSSDQARVAAEEILDYAGTVSKAVSKLRLAGCTEAQINFVPALYQVDPPLAPADKSCNVFDINGGKVNYVAPQTTWLKDSTFIGWWFNGQTPITNIGTSAPELLMWQTTLKPEVCQAINQILNHSDVMLDVVGNHTTGADGTFSPVADGIGDDVGSTYAGKAAGCIGTSTGGTLYYTLIAR